VEYEKELRFLGTALPPQNLSTFEALREVTGWVRPKHDHGCKPCTIVSGVWTAHYHDIDTKEKLAKVAPKVPYVSSYYYICVASMVPCSGGLYKLSLSVAPKVPQVSSYYYIFVLILLYMCPQSSYYYMCPHISMCPHTTKHVSPGAAYRKLLYMCCHHTTMHVFSYYYVSSYY
jgi:hypothetical protein